LLAPQGQLALANIDAQDPDLDLVTGLYDLLRAAHLVVGQLRDVQQALQAGLQFDEHAEVGQLGDFTRLYVAGVVAAGDVALPRVAGHLLEAQGHVLALRVHVQDDALEQGQVVRRTHPGCVNSTAFDGCLLRRRRGRRAPSPASRGGHNHRSNRAWTAFGSASFPSSMMSIPE
jgi:hypothetical protein